MHTFADPLAERLFQVARCCSEFIRRHVLVIDVWDVSCKDGPFTDSWLSHPKWILQSRAGRCREGTFVMETDPRVVYLV